MNEKYRITSIKRENLVDTVSQELLNLILDGTFPIGEKLPPENKLAELYNVSKFTIRLALQKLSSIGVAETINGEGTYIREFSFEEYVDKANELLYEEEMLDDVQVFRWTIELEAGRLAIENATDEELDELVEAAQWTEVLKYDENKTLSENVNNFIINDYNLHLKIIELSKNRLFYLSFIACKSVILEYLYKIMETRTIKANRESKNIERYPYSNHIPLAESIRNRDFETYKKLFYKMVNISDARSDETPER